MILEEKVTQLSWKQMVIPLISLIMLGCLILNVAFQSDFQRLSVFDTYKFATNKMISMYAVDLSFFRYLNKEDAENKVVETFPFELRAEVKKIIRPVLHLSEKYQLDPFWVLSVLWTESHFKSNAVSRSGARGLMQIMPLTYNALKEEMISKEIIFEAEKDDYIIDDQYPSFYREFGSETVKRKLYNLEVGIYYLQKLLMEFEGNHTYATIAYNMGPSWARYRLKNNLAIGVKNLYLSKVMNAYNYLARNLVSFDDIKIVQNSSDESNTYQ